MTDADLARFDRDGARRWPAHLADRELAPATRDRRWSTVMVRARATDSTSLGVTQRHGRWTRDAA
ncbi:hypothetical protein JCM13210_21630 [Thermaerobacter litoralis]